MYCNTYSYYLLPFTKQMCVSSDDQILYISWIHVEHILTQWLHFTFYKELSCAFASVLLLGNLSALRNKGYMVGTIMKQRLPFTFYKELARSFRWPIFVYIRDVEHILMTYWHIDASKYNVYISKIVNCKTYLYNMNQGQNITKFWPKTTM